MAVVCGDTAVKSAEPMTAFRSRDHLLAFPGLGYPVSEAVKDEALVIAPVAGVLKAGRRTVTVDRTVATARSIEFDALVVGGGATPTSDIKPSCCSKKGSATARPIAAWGDGGAVLKSARISSSDPGVEVPRRSTRPSPRIWLRRWVFIGSGAGPPKSCHRPSRPPPDHRCINSRKTIRKLGLTDHDRDSGCRCHAAASVGCIGQRMDLLRMGRRHSRIGAVASNWPAGGARILHSIGTWPAVINDETVVESCILGQVVCGGYRASIAGYPYCMVEPHPSRDEELENAVDELQEGVTEERRGQGVPGNASDRERMPPKKSEDDEPPD